MLKRGLKKIFGRVDAARSGFLVGLTYEELEEITRTFRKKQQYAEGPYGRFYTGATGNGRLATVMILEIGIPGLDDDLFEKMLHALSVLDHPNLVRLLGYFYDTGRDLMRVLYLEYLPNASLDSHLSDALSGMDWHTRYRIIKGTCEALKYIHSGMEEPLQHILLQPSNIMLDENMEPKLAALGLVKIIYKHLTPLDTRYCPPEYNERGVLSEKFDIFSLGVVILEIVTGPMDCFTKANELPRQFIDQAEQQWRKRLQVTCSGSELELYCQQVKRCIMLALRCVENYRHDRPNIMGIIYKLNETDSNVGQTKVDQWDQDVQCYQEMSAQIVGENSSELKVLKDTVDGTEDPRNLSLPLLRLITKNFSDELIIGKGGCGMVYKGILPNGIIIAVKRLLNCHTIEDKMFDHEVKSMMKVKHQNIVRFLGYCSHTEGKAEDLAGKFIMAEIRERLLCFEYINNGSLENLLSDELRGLEWHTRYQIIKGICQGLHYLHKEKHIIHMDLKPANILIDDHMVPKITDFGLSRLDDESQTVSAKRLLSLGYCAPEYLHYGRRSAKSDIYSLGVIIMELVTGSKPNPCTTKVLRRWKRRWTKSTNDTPFGYKQVAKCLDWARRCIQIEPADRPDIGDITSDLNKMDSEHISDSEDTEHLELSDMLRVEPLHIHLPLELNKQISCSIELTNDTDVYFAFRISTASLLPFCINPSKGILSPQSKLSVIVALQALEKAPRHNCCRDEFSIQSTRIDEGFITTTNLSLDIFKDEQGKGVDEVNLTVILDEASQSQD